MGKNHSEPVEIVEDVEDELETPEAYTGPVAFDLDAETGKKSTVAPFWAKIGGVPTLLANPEDVDWQVWEVVMSSNSAYQVLGALLDEEGAERFFEADVTLGAVRRLLEAWKEHYGVDMTVMSQNPAANRAERRAARGKTARRK